MTGRSSKTAQLAKAWVGTALTALFLLCGLGVIGSTPSQTTSHEGGEWTYGAHGGRTFSQYMHPDEWHRTGVLGRRKRWSECVAPGEIARVSTAQSMIGWNRFYAETCQPPAHSDSRLARSNAN